MGGWFGAQVKETHLKLRAAPKTELFLFEAPYLLDLWFGILVLVPTSF